MPIDPVRRGLVTGFACVGAGAALPCCFPHRRAGGRATDFALSEIADGVFAFRGVNELMTAGNEGAICNLGIVVGDGSGRRRSTAAAASSRRGPSSPRSRRLRQSRSAT